MPVSLFIEPTYPEFLENALFSPDSRLNRDDQLRPYISLKETLEAGGIRVNTVDFFLRGERLSKRNLFVSLGGTRFWKQLAGRADISLEAFVLLEPPVANPTIYEGLKEYGPLFRRVFAFSTGPGLERYLPPGLLLERFFCPQPYGGVIEGLWENRDRKFLTAVISNKRPMGPGPELYSERIRAVKYFARHDQIDLYGPHWDKPFPTHPFHFRWFFDLPLRRSRRGPVASKYNTLAQYDFAICYENMALEGYITEKLFDCLYTGTIPIYLGAPDIDRFIPTDVFIDKRKFADYGELSSYVSALKPEEIGRYREAGRGFLGSERFAPFSHAGLANLLISLTKPTGISCRTPK